MRHIPARPEQPIPENIDVVMAQMAALCHLMHFEGRKVFEALSGPCRAELSGALDRLGAELLQLGGMEANHG